MAKSYSVTARGWIERAREAECSAAGHWRSLICRSVAGGVVTMKPGYSLSLQVIANTQPAFSFSAEQESKRSSPSSPIWNAAGEWNAARHRRDNRRRSTAPGLARPEMGSIGGASTTDHQNRVRPNPNRQLLDISQASTIGPATKARHITMAAMITKESTDACLQR